MADRKTVKDEGTPPHDVGQFAAVCVDVIDMGFKVEKYADNPAALKDKTVLVFRTENADGDDHPRYMSQEFSTSMGKKSNMRKFLESWRGKAYTDDEARKQGIPLDKLEGVGGLVTVAHKTSAKGNTYAVMQAIVPLPKQMRDALPPTNGYERADFWAKRKAEYAKLADEFRAKNAGNPGGKAQGAEDYGDPEYTGGDEPDDSDLPF